MTRTLSIALALAFGFAATEASAQDRCDAPQVLVVVDHSSSMGTRAPLADGTLKWTAATTAIQEVTSTYESSVDFGLMVYPSEGECTPGRVDVPVGTMNATAIAGALPPAPPYSGNYTPTAESLEAAASYAALTAPGRRSFVLLITDGWQWCSPYDPATRFDPVRSTERLAVLGVPVHVVGFGDSVDALALNRMAHAAGTARPGCDPTSDDFGRTDNCYHQVDDLAALRAALDGVARAVTEEICDGLDNNCDGRIDEDLFRPCETECGRGTERCVMGEWVDCDARLPTDEICDGIDNDCDGTVDEGCDCIDGETRPCGSSTGDCVEGAQLCDDGAWGPCDGAVGPTEEICDGRDNDCDGLIDNGADCGAGFACIDGQCVDLNTDPEDDNPPEDEADDGGSGALAATGCACRAASGSHGAAGSVFLAGLLLGLGLLARRR